MRRDIFQAIADPTTRAILALETMTPNALAAHFATTRQAISKPPAHPGRMQTGPNRTAGPGDIRYP